MKCNRPLIIAALVVAIAAHLTAAENRWTSRGPRGGTVTALVADPMHPEILYATIYGAGVLKTEDGGASWRAVNEGLFDPLIRTAILRRDAAASLFVGTDRGYVFRSRDQGAHWTEVAKLPWSIGSLVLDAKNSLLFAATGNTILRSSDDGDTWQDVTTIRDAKLATLEGNVYALREAILYVSQDGGANWKPMLGLPVTPSLIAIDEAQWTIIIAGNGRVARSVDGGAKWELLPPFGANFAATRINALLPDATGIIATTHDGVLRYDYSAKEWKRVGDAAFTDGQVLARSSATPARLFVFSSGAAPSLYSILDGDREWSAVDLELRFPYTTDVTVYGSTVYAAGTHLSKLAADAESWEAIEVPLASHVTGIAVSSPETLIAATETGLQKSDDSGGTWQMVTPQSTVTAFAVAPSDSKVVYAALSDAMSKSTDGGNTWTSIQNDMPLNYYYFFYGFVASAIAVDPHDANIAFVSSEGVYKTIDGGKHWIPIVMDHSFSSIAIDHVDASLVYGAMWDGSMLRSNDGGMNWTGVDSMYDAVATIVTDPARASVVYAGTWRGSVYRSVDAAHHWSVLDVGLTGSPITALAIDSSGDRLYAATAGGVFEYERSWRYLAGATTFAVSLKTYYGNYVAADDCGGASVSADAASAEGCATFTLYDVNGGQLEDGDRVYVQAANGDFWAAENGGSQGCAGCDSPVLANRAVAGSWETFTIHNVSSPGATIGDATSISLQSVNGDYLAAEKGGSNDCNCHSAVNANRVVAREWETFTLRIH